MKEVSSCRENIDTEAISGRKKKKLNSLLKQTGLLLAKVPSCHENLTWKRPESIPNYTEVIAQPIGPFAFILLYGRPFSINDHYLGVLWQRPP